jgi:hypothetical protein
VHNWPHVSAELPRLAAHSDRSVLWGHRRHGHRCVVRLLVLLRRDRGKDGDWLMGCVRLRPCRVGRGASRGDVRGVLRLRNVRATKHHRLAWGVLHDRGDCWLLLLLRQPVGVGNDHHKAGTGGLHWEPRRLLLLLLWSAARGIHPSAWGACCRPIKKGNWQKRGCPTRGVWSSRL